MLKKFDINFSSAVSQFEKIIKDFQMRKVVYKTVFRGKGLEFDSYRDLNPEDDAGMIDWKASLRSNKLLAKQYVEERDTDIYFVVDSSNSMLFGSGKKLKAEYSAEVVAALSHLIANSDDKPGLIMYSDKEVKVVHPGKTRNQFFLMIKSLSEPNFYGGRFNLANCIDYILKTVRSKYSVIILVSDFINSDNEKELKLLTAKFETMAIMIRDPLDERIPKSSYQIVLQDPNSNKQILVDPSLVAERYYESAMRKKQEVKEKFKQIGIDLLELHTDNPFVIDLAAFLKLRAGGQ